MKNDTIQFQKGLSLTKFFNCYALKNNARTPFLSSNGLTDFDAPNADTIDFAL